MSTNEFDSATTIEELLGQLAGAASMCWSDVRAAGEFQSTRAAELVAQAQERLVDLMGVRQAKAEAWREGYRAALSPEARQLMDEVREGVLRSTGRYDENSEPDPTATGEAERWRYLDTLCRGCHHPRRFHRDAGLENPSYSTMPCWARDIDVTDDDREVECMCLGWWEPGTECPYQGPEWDEWEANVQAEFERRGTGSEDVALYQVRSDEDGPLEVVLDPDAPIGGGVVYSEELFEIFSNLGKGSYRLGKEYTERLREELGVIERTNFADYLDALEKQVDAWPGEWPEEEK